MSEAQHGFPILVTGAAGRIGSVGRMVTELLLARGFRVRAQVRVDDERAAMLRDWGAEVVVGDLLDLSAVHRAVEGCEPARSRSSTGWPSRYCAGPGFRWSR